MRLQHPDHHRRDRLVELEHDVANEAVADDDVDRSAIAAAGREVAALDVALEVHACGPQQLVGFLDDRVPLLRFLADAEEADDRVVATQHVLGVHGAESRELHELLRGAVDVRAGVEHDDGLPRGREQRGDRRPR